MEARHFPLDTLPVGCLPLFMPERTYALVFLSILYYLPIMYILLLWG